MNYSHHDSCAFFLQTRLQISYVFMKNVFSPTKKCDEKRAVVLQIPLTPGVRDDNRSPCPLLHSSLWDTVSSVSARPTHWDSSAGVQCRTPVAFTSRRTPGTGWDRSPYPPGPPSLPGVNSCLRTAGCHRSPSRPGSLRVSSIITSTGPVKTPTHSTRRC